MLISDRRFSQPEANGAASFLATITFLGQPADIIGPEAAMLAAGPDDGTPTFQSAGERWTALLLATVPAGERPDWAGARYSEPATYRHHEGRGST